MQRIERSDLVMKFAGQLTPGARIFGAVLAMELCGLTTRNPRAHATITTYGLEFGDVVTLYRLCGEFGLELSIATASEESAEPRLRLQRVGPRSAQPLKFWRSKLAARVKTHLAMRRVH